jgi:transcription antitermination factor NusG
MTVVANKYEFVKGESIRIKVGVLKGTLTVMVEVFGKPQPIELTFLEVEKLDREISTDYRT